MLTSKLLEQKERKNLQISTFTEYSKDFDVDVIFPREEIKTTLAKEISQAGLTQTHIAETEKFPHATFFLNGGVEEPYRGEEHVLLNSRKDVATHDLAPEMKAKEIADKVIESIERDDNFIFVNFANPDMVGHSANVPAIIESIEFLDKQLERVVNKIIENGGVAIVTADHGNAELNIDPVTGEKHTAHTINPVPFIITKEGISVEKGGLSDIAPTVLKMFEIKKPDSMSGNNLIVG
jgi:2,3-bisphosphoglycerate-independent phosphoglycerate mutase